MLDGTVQKIENYVTVNFTAQLTEEKDAFYLEDATAYVATPLKAEYNKDLSDAIGGNVFIHTSKEYDLTDLVAKFSDAEKLVWNQAVEKYQGDASVFSSTLIGGDGENNTTGNLGDNKEVAEHISYVIKDNKIQFKFAVSSIYANNFILDKAYQYTISVVDPDNKGAKLATIVLPFEFTMPDCPVTRDYDKSISADKSVLWTSVLINNENIDVLKVYGELSNDNKIFGDLRDAFLNSFENKAGAYTATLESGYYQMSVDQVSSQNVLMGANTNEQVVSLNEIASGSLWSTWNTYQRFINGAPFADMLAKNVVYNHYGVYQQELPMFYVQFASKIEDSQKPTYNTVSGQTGNGEEKTPLMAQTVYKADKVTLDYYQVTLTDANFILKDAFGDEYKLFDKVSLKNDGTVNEAIKRNVINNMWANNREGINDNVNCYGLNPTAKVDGQINEDVTINLIDVRGDVIDSDDFDPASQYPTGLKVVIPASVAAAKNNLVEVTLNITDVFGHVYQLPVYIQTVK